MKKNIARLTSGIVNPFSVGLLMVILLSFRSAPSLSRALQWSLVPLLLVILPILAILFYLVRNEKLDSIFIKARRQRSKIYLLAILSTAVSFVVLWHLSAPPELLAAFVAALLAMVIYLCINIWWKISVHTGFLTASVTVLVALYGLSGLASGILLPLTGWSRIELEHHSPAQVVAGGVLAALIVIGVFHFFGLFDSAASL